MRYQVSFKALLLATSLAVPAMLLNPAGAQDSLSDNCGKLVERLAEFDGTIELNNQPQDTFALQKLAEANRDEECKVVIEQMKVEANQADSSQAQSGESQSDSMKASGADGKSGGANAGSKPDNSDQKMSGSSEGTGKSGKAHNSDMAKSGHADKTNPADKTNQADKANQTDKANQADSKMSAASGKADQSDQQMSQAGDGSKQSGNQKDGSQGHASADSAKQSGDGMSGSSDQSGGKTSDSGKSSESSGQEMSEADDQGAQSGQQSADAEEQMRDRMTAQDGDGNLNEGTNQTVTVGAITGQNVFNGSGQELGEIERVVRMDGQEYVVVQHGGFLGIGDSETAVPLDRLTRRGDQFVLRAMTEEELDRMPEFDAGEGQDVRNSEEVQLNVQS